LILLLFNVMMIIIMSVRYRAQEVGDDIPNSARPT
jgi:hypothetical protein